MKDSLMMARSFLLALMLTGLAACSHAPLVLTQPQAMPEYNYPIDNPYAATIVGTPISMKAKAPWKELTERRLVVFPDRKVPEGFWYYNELVYGEMLQHKAAPLIYVIGGTGATYNAYYTRSLANLLYSMGYHVITLPSSTQSNFIISASSSFIPGNAQTDAADMYNVINLIQSRLAKKVKITSTSLTGYSLGAWNAAFVANLDDREKRIGFNKVLIMNPPLDLYHSMQKLDRMLAGLPGGIDGLDKFLDAILSNLSSLNGSSDALDFSTATNLGEGFLKSKPSDELMATIIGLSFRLSAANMIFTSDVMSHSGYVYPNDRPFRSSTPLKEYMAAALRTGFGDYYRDIYSVHYKQGNDDTDEKLAADNSLMSLRGWLANCPNIALIGNRDDIVLSEGEASQLEGLFPGKSYIFPTGGHMGNFESPSFRWQIAHFLDEGAR